MTTPRSVITAKISADTYKETIPWVSRSTKKASLEPLKQETMLKFQARKQESNMLKLKFQADLAEAYGLTGHPKEPALFDIAWGFGHSGGYTEVLEYYDPMSVLLID